MNKLSVKLKLCKTGKIADLLPELTAGPLGKELINEGISNIKRKS